MDTHLTRLLDALPDTTAHAALCLSVHPGYLTHATATAMLDVVPDEAARVLDALTEAGILQASDEGRWSVHDRVRPTLAKHATTHERAQAVDRIAAHYRLRAAAAEDHLNPWRYRIDTEAAVLASAAQRDQETVWFASTDEALGWADSELENLVPIAEMLAAEGRPEPWQLADLLGSYLHKRRPLEVSRPLYRIALRAAEEQGELAAVGIVHRRLALVAEGADRKLEHSRSALRAYEAVGHERGVATGHEGLGSAYFGLGDIDTAVWHVRTSVRLHERLDNPRGLSVQLRQLGRLLALQGKHQEALELIVRAHRIQSELEVPDLHQMGRSTAALVEVSLSQADAEGREFSGPEHAALMIAAQAGTTLMRKDGALGRLAQMREQLADLTRDLEHKREQLSAALALNVRLGQHADADRIRTLLDRLAHQ